MANLAERAQRLNRGSRRPFFALLTDRERLPDPRPVLPLLPRGSLVVLRAYDAPDRPALAGAFVRACRARGLTPVIAGDLDTAVALGAGLHLPEWRVRTAGARIRLWHRRTKRTLTAAAHSRMALSRAATLGADAALLGPVFATASHPNAKTLGALRIRMMTRGAGLPVWALGGVNEMTIKFLERSKVKGIATVGGLSRVPLTLPLTRVPPSPARKREGPALAGG